MRKLLTLLLLLIASPAFAQAWTTGGGDQGADFTNYTTSATTTAPADTYEPAEIDVTALGLTKTDWIVTVSDQLGIDFVKGSTRERKIRLNCEPSTAKTKDNILGFGTSSFGHLHMGYGAVNWDENSTYTTLRNSPSSTCSGGPLNATNYMEPAVQKPLGSSGLVATVRAQDQAVYYVTGLQQDANPYTWLRRGMEFVIGANPKDFNDTARRAAYAAGGFEYPGSPVHPAGIIGWYCTLNNGSTATVSNTTAQIQGGSGAHITTLARYLRGPSGEDPWGGNCTGTIAAPATITSDIQAPGCWDRYNLTAPDGRGHFWYAARKGDNSVTNACPSTVPATSGHAITIYGHVPEGEFKNIYPTTGFADYGTWYLSSDRMRVATTECPDAANPCDGTSGGNVPATVNGVAYSRVSLSPCRSTGQDFCNGETIHADYTFGWVTTGVFDQAMRECLAIPVRGTATVDGPAECNTSLIDRTHRLALGTSPNSTYSGGCTNIGGCYNSTPGNTERYVPITAGTGANVTVHHAH